MKYDVCIVGAGIVGLAHAYWALKKGLKVLVIEKSPSCQGASIRNFGLFWQIGQEKKYQNLATDSKKVWNEFFYDTNIWNKPFGSLGLAYHADEMDLIEEFCQINPESDYKVLSKKKVLESYSFVNEHKLAGALYSPNEVVINSREVIPAIAEWLTEKYNVSFLFNTWVTAIDLPKLYTNKDAIKCKRVVITTGADFELFYPNVFSDEKITKCKLQMIKTLPVNSIIEPAVFSATSFVHYASFANCKKLKEVNARLKKEKKQHLDFGINLLIAQNNYNELLIGDSHEYDNHVSPFNKELIDNLILEEIKKIIPKVEIQIKERWHGVYVKHQTKKYIVSRPDPNVLIVNALAGAGMTLGFGLAKETIKQFV